MIPAFLYKFDDDTKDPKGESNAVFLISSSVDEDFLRSQGDSFDHGGMDSDDFDRAWTQGVITKITSIEQIPVECLEFIVFVSGELDDPEFTTLEFCEEMDYNGSVLLKKYME